MTSNTFAQKGAWTNERWIVTDIGSHCVVRDLGGRSQINLVAAATQEGGVVRPPIAEPATQEKKRLLDRCRHFLGEIVNGKIRIYCSQCRQFFVLKTEDLERHLNQGV